MRAKSILILNRVFPPTLGATGRVACDLALHLRKQGHKITVITTNDHAKNDRAKNLDVIRVQADMSPQSPWDYFKIARAMHKATKKLPKHDIVISMTDPPLLGIFGAKIANKMRAKHVHWAMDLYPDLLPTIGKTISPFMFRVLQGRMLKMMKRADALVPISNCMARYLTHNALPKTNMHVIENWPDKYLLENNHSDQSLMDDTKFRVLYAGTIGLAHEFDTIIGAAIYFQKTDPDIEFVFTLRGRGADEFQKQCHRKAVKNIQFISPQPSKKLNALMNAGDIHLVTMKPSAAGKLFPSKFYSALAASRPVIFIGPASCDIHRKISKHQCGATIRNGEGQMLVNAITNYKTNADEYFKACENASNLLKQNDPLGQWRQLIEKI
jgi:colanic acid biosynthesis glycosyl transferase WcaI